jgi:hypothetical protein
MRAQACDIARGENRTVDAAGLHGIKKGSGGLGAFEHGFEGLGKWLRL